MARTKAKAVEEARTTKTRGGNVAIFGGHCTMASVKITLLRENFHHGVSRHILTYSRFDILPNILSDIDSAIFPGILSSNLAFYLAPILAFDLAF